ncbi:hypothetical protein LXL04_036130 [Taraxacum kok-saghyz]
MQTTLHGFLYKRKNTSSSQNAENPPEVVLDENVSPSTIPLSSPTQAPSPIPAPSVMPTCESQPKRTRTEINGIDLSTIERDPGMRTQIYDYPERDTMANEHLLLMGFKSGRKSVAKHVYYVHCFAHRLQLALMAAAQGVIALRKFFTQLSFVVNVAGASSKRSDQLRDAQAEENEYLISIDELETGKGLNQLGTLQRAGDTRWSSHLKSVSSLIKMFSPTCQVLLKIIEEGTGSIRGDADSAYESVTTFDFIFVLHLEKEILGITDLLCQALQRQSQDILNALRLVVSTKVLLQKMKNERWEDLISRVKSFCLLRKIDVPDLSSPYLSRGARARNEHSDHNLEHHYRVDVFNEAINCQLMELDHRFNDSSMDLLRLSTTLDPKSANEPFRSVDVCHLVDKYYPQDFSVYEKDLLQIQLQHYEVDVVQNAEYKQLKSISELCQWLIKTGRVPNFHLIYRVATLILILPVSTATTERSFSAMNLVKTRLRNKMEDEILNDSLVLYIEREIAEKIDLEVVLQDFKLAGDRRVPL